MKEEEIPTAKYRVFEVQKDALEYIKTQSFPLVIKADGLAAGKGVVIAKTIREAEQAVEDSMLRKIYGNSGSRIVVEEYLDGFEISIHAFCDGNTAVLFPASKDHKHIFDGDKGLNTGGMGTIAPVPGITNRDMERIRDSIILPTLAGLKKRGRSFRGILFPGVMMTKNGPKVIEFNARFGDPEMQSYVRILESDLFDILHACAAGSLTGVEIKWSSDSVCCIVLVSAGYPGSYDRGMEIELPKDTDDIVVFHAGTARREKELITNGGRVLGVTATGKTLKRALETAYGSINLNIFANMQYRKDIGATSIPADQQY